MTLSEDGPDERARAWALAMLARREHSSKELEQKLLHKGVSSSLIPTLIADLQAQRLLDDERYAEMLVRVRRERGYGPVRIRQELQEKGVGVEVIARQLDFADATWLDVVRGVRNKRFGATRPANMTERARQTRFLLARGFTGEQVRGALNLQGEE